jgi:hypothetical protein
MGCAGPGSARPGGTPPSRPGPGSTGSGRTDPRRWGGQAIYPARLASVVSGLLLAGLLAGCSFGGPPPSGQARADAEAAAACRQRADAVYEQQNRGAIYSPQAGVNTPSSGAYAPGGVDDRRLSDLYSRDTMISDCVRNTGTQTDRGRSPTVGNSP